MEKPTTTSRRIARELREKLGGKSGSSPPEKRTVGTLYPNGEFSYAFCPPAFDVSWEFEPDEYLYADKDMDKKSNSAIENKIISPNLGLV